VAIRASASTQIDALIRDLRSANAVAREAAIARLTLIGSRAVERLIVVAADDGAAADTRASAWRALEAIGDARALEPALRTLAVGTLVPAVAVAAIASARPFIKGPRGAAVVDRLTPIALDRARPEVVRLAALRALRDLERATIAPLLASLANDPSAAIRDEAAAGGQTPRDVKRRERQTQGTASVAPASLITSAAERQLPDDPKALRAALHEAGGAVSLPALLRVVERVREREGAEPPARRDEWRLVRAAAHQALADRGSRLALYDLRESLHNLKREMPVEFLGPLTAIGDASCLEAIAAEHAAARDPWWRQRLTEAFYAIVARERLTQRSAILKKIGKRWPALAGRPASAGAPGQGRRAGKAGQSA
jgi:hypothetical protein